MSSRRGADTVEWSDCIWRVARRREPVHYSQIEPQDERSNAGNRFDVPGGGVLYAAGTVEACFVETLARFRPTKGVRAAVHHDEGYMNAGALPAAWREDRCIARIMPGNGCLPFIDIDNSDTLTFLDKELRAELGLLGIDQLDRGTIYSSARAVTRLLARWGPSALRDRICPFVSL
ncbi:MAG: RES domain-containing protein [Candidatus Nanopelagicales bacterium]|nr:RES domain-containing protein [Candidatus Nanopelagicales bacterium]MDZ4249422.1 RES domain-containing protein [Candidatus Nanopelagicales bacterium]